MRIIETKYRGVQFRSRLEARWAVYLDSVGIEWIYEPECYALRIDSREVLYLPDFWFPHYECFAEVKPGVFSEEEKKRAIALARESGHMVLRLEGYPESKMYFGYRCDNSGVDGWGEGPGVELTDYEISGWYAAEHRFYVCSGHSYPNYAPTCSDVSEAVRKARSVRFYEPREVQ